MGGGGAGFGACCIVLRCGGGVILSCRDRILYCSHSPAISLLVYQAAMDIAMLYHIYAYY